jgi:hypothetical protein
MRMLISTHRHVPLDLADDYQLAWQAVQRAVGAAGGSAWLFRRVGHEDRFMEFIEWPGDAASPLDQEEVTASLAQLSSFGTPTGREEWEEAT